MNKSTDTDLLNEIRPFTADIAGLDPNEIREHSLLEKDLGVYGDDAVEYLIAFGKRFNVNVSRFMAADYFSGEGISLNWPFGHASQKKELSIAHLIKSVKAGRLDEAVINNEAKEK